MPTSAADFDDSDFASSHYNPAYLPYDAPAADGSRTVRTEIKVAGLPVGATAHQTIKPLGENETSVDVTGEVQANIPLVGKKIAAAAEPYIGKALTLQARQAEAWIAKN